MHDLCITATATSKSWYGTRCYATHSHRNEAQTSRELAVDFYDNTGRVFTHVHTNIFQLSVKDTRRKDSSAHCKFYLVSVHYWKFIVYI